MKEKVTLKQWVSVPRNIFLIDALGALLSCLLLYGILIPYRSIFGMPDTALYVLSGTAFLLFVFSITNYLITSSDSSHRLIRIIILNSLYVVISVIFVWLHASQLSPWGFGYFGAEIAILILLLILESWAYLKNKNHTDRKNQSTWHKPQ